MEHLCKYFFLGVLCFSMTFYQVESDIFSASGSMQKLARDETTLRASLRKDFRKIQGEDPKTDRIVKEIMGHNFTSSEKDVIDFISHPLNSYRLIKNWHFLNENQHMFKRLKATIAIMRVHLPDQDDRRGSSVAIIRLTHTYALDVPELIAGRILGVQGSPLIASDCMEIGRQAYILQDYALTLQWYNGALTTYNDKDFNKLQCYLEIADIHFLNKDYQRALEYAKEALKLDEKNKEVMSKVRKYKIDNEIAKKSGHVVKIPAEKLPRKHMSALKYMYEALCRGDPIKQVREVKKPLVCKHKKTNIPYTLTREEILNWDPRMGQIHDIITDREAEHIKNISINKLERCEIGNPGSSIVSDIRTSKLVWLWDQDDKLIKKLSARVKQITGLDTSYRERFTSAEAFQMLNYGLGGHYEMHVDFFEDPKALEGVIENLKGTGDRIMTFLFYLGDIIHGGKTAFPKVKVAVPAVPNAATYWYNMKRNGIYDQRTLHAGCPVLLGEKWVMNKWIRDYNQHFRRPCGLKENALDPLE